nr:MAG TPA: hypothetical protein [Caudoviricetes sp.]
MFFIDIHRKIIRIFLEYYFTLKYFKIFLALKYHLISI